MRGGLVGASSIDVPEPATVVVLGIGLVGLAILAWFLSRRGRRR